MQSKVIYMFSLMICWALIGCSESPDAGQNEESEMVQAGDYYSFVSVEGDFKVLKVLKVDKDLFHFCYYNNVFSERPSEDVIATLFFGKDMHDTTIDISDGRQTTGRKHVALPLKGLNYLKTEFLSSGAVIPDELVAFEKWQSGDNYVLPSGTTISN